MKIELALHQKYLQIEHSKPVMYVELRNALCGTLWAAILFWKHLSSVLMDQGFVLNPYDSCVANKAIDGKQCTMLWHVDDLKCSHGSSSGNFSL